MKKKALAVIIIIALAAQLTPAVSRAVVTPYFTAVNDTLLPFSEDTMPYISGGEVFVPHEMFAGVGVWSVAARELGQVRLWGGDKYVDFYTGSASVKDHYGRDLPWQPVQRIGGRFYVPVREVCRFFGLICEVIAVSRDIIPQEQTWIVRIRSEPGINELSFAGVYRNALRTAYNEFHSVPPEDEPSDATETPAETVTPTPPAETPPSYTDITIYLSFNDISSGGADVMLRLLDATSGRAYQFCFFVDAEDITENAGIIRRIASDGHTIGIWLDEGTYEEYSETSALLFEAAKIKTLLVMTGAETSVRRGALEDHGLILWEADRGLAYDDTLSVAEVTERITVSRGAGQNLLTGCSDNAALMLSGILSYLQEFEYSIMKINETADPV